MYLDCFILINQNVIAVNLNLILFLRLKKIEQL